MKNFLLTLPLLSLLACGSSDKPTATSDKDVLMSSDIDGVAGWLNDQNSLVKGEAHSGEYSLRVDSNHEFSPGYTAILGKLTPTRPRGVRLEAWAYVPSKSATAKLEFVINDAVGGKEILRNQTKLDEVKEYGKWVPISTEIIFPATVTYSSQIIIYVSRAGATAPAYVDDLKLTALR